MKVPWRIESLTHDAQTVVRNELLYIIIRFSLFVIHHSLLIFDKRMQEDYPCSFYAVCVLNIEPFLCNMKIISSLSMIVPLRIL